MGPVNHPAHTQISSLLITSRTAIKVLVACLVIATVPLALYVRVDSKSPKTTSTSKTAITVRASSQSKPYFKVQDGREMTVGYRGDQSLTDALRSGVAEPRALASADIDHNGTPDVVAGYSFNGAGMITLHRGNPDAFAPTDDSVFERMQQGYNPESLMPVADVYPVPVPVDFLAMGKFSSDSVTDVLIAAKNGGLYLMTGDGRGGLGVAEQIALPGAVTALAVGEFRAADGLTDIAVGVAGPSGDVLLVCDDLEQGFENAVVQQHLSGPASAIEFGGLDDDPFQDVAVAAGKEVAIVHGWGRKVEVAPAGQVEHVSLSANVSGLALGQFVWDRKGRIEVAALTEDGSVQLLRNGKLDTRPFTDAELVQRNRGRFKATRSSAKVDLESIVGWDPGKAAGWSAHSKFAASSLKAQSPASPKLLMRTNASFRENDDLLLLSESDSKLEFVRQMAPSDIAAGNAALFENGSAKVSLDVSSSPTAVLALPKKLNGVSDVVVLRSGKPEPSIVPLAPNTTITVDRTDDPSGAGLAAVSACTAAGSDCSLRGALQFANNAANNNTTISLPANTYILSANGTGAGGCDGNAVGDLGANQTMSIVGAGAATTIIRQTGTGPANDGDRIMCMNEPFTVSLIYNFSGVTFVGGREGTAAGTGTVLGGAGIIGGELNNSLTMTNVVMANNQETVAGSANLGGGAIQITGGNLIITNSTIGGSAAPGAYTDRSSTTTGNVQTGSGGGVTYTPSSPAHTGGTGTLTVTGSTFSRNTAAGIGGGGADLLIFAFAAPGGIGSGSASIGTSTFSNNQGLGTANGGGIIVESLPTTINSSTNFNTNSASNRGGGIYVGGGSLLLNGAALPAITFSGNTAPSGGSSISTTAIVNVDGTNTTIGGDIEINTGGTWTNNAGSALSPTNVVVNGGTFTMNNSTMNVSGNLSIASAPLFVGTFNGGTGTVNIQGNFSFTAGGPAPGTTLNAGTGTFNFNGTGSQSISNTASITFFNLTDSNITQPLTANNSFAVGGTLNVNGTNAIFAPVAGAVISGAGTLTGTGTARVTRIAATADFSTQYSITNKTLTNLTVEYIGAAAQVLSPITYGPLKINNGNGVNLSGTSTVNGLLTLTTGALGVGNQTLIINNGSSVGAGSITSNAAGTVNYNQGTNGQNVRAFNYGNLTFSNFTKVLEPAGTIGISGIFTPGTAIGHTITGSTINFNGTGAQTVPAFNYNNLTISGARGANNVTLANGGTIGVAGIFNPIATFAGGNYVIINNTVDFNGSGAQTIPAFNYFNLTSSNVGARTLANSGIIGIASVFTPGTNAYTIAGSTVSYNGTSPQTLPPTFITYFNLTSNNAAGVTGFAGLTVQALLRMQTGTFTSNSGTYNNVQIDAGATLAGTNATTINVSGNWTNNGTFTANTNTVNFNGSGAQVIGGSSVTTFSNLTIANAGSGVSLGQNATVNAVLTLTNNLTTGANILTMPNTGTSAGTADVIGNVRRTGFTGGGPALSFGNPFNSIGFIAQGTVPTDILVNLVKATPTGPPTFPTAVQRTYTITPTGGAGYSATLRLHYLDAELNGNVEADLGLWRLFGGAWARQGRTGAVDTVNNWAELSGVTQFSPWTLASAKNDTTTTITSDNPDPSTIGQVVTVNYTVTSNVAGAPPVTGNVTVTVNDLSGDTCIGTVAAGTCALTLTTSGSKTLTATYSSDANFNGSSDTEAHVVAIPDINVRDGRAAEPASGTTNLVFTVALSMPAPTAVSVNFQTADGGANPATAGTCGAGGDYVTTSGTVNFAVGQQVQSIAVPICADGAVETDETFLVNLSSPVNGTIVDGQAVGTITTTNTPGTILISEVRTSGPGGLGDDFVEIYNNSDSPLNVQAVDASAGLGVFKMGATCGDTPVLIGTIPNGTLIPARGHYLMVGSAYSLANYGGVGAAAGNLTLSSDIEADRNIGLFATANIQNISSETGRDAVGFGLNTGGNCDLLREPSNLATANDSTAQYSFFRKTTTGLPQDTNDNTADFAIVSTDSSVAIGGNTTPVLGAPGPENLASPIQRNASIKASLIDPLAVSTVAPNRVRDTNLYTDTLTPSSPSGAPPGPDPGNNYALGTLSIRRKFTNNTGAPVTRLRFRIVDVTSPNAPPGGVGQADVRTLSSATGLVTITGGGSVTVQGLTLEQTTQAKGGGLNSSVVTVATPIANGASVNVNFLLGVAAGGTYRFFINVEALP